MNLFKGQLFCVLCIFILCNNAIHGYTGEPDSEGRVEKTNFFVIASYDKFKGVDSVEKRLLLEKYFLLLQKRKLERVDEPSPEIKKFLRLIKIQLIRINSQLRAKHKTELRPKLVLS